VSGTIRLELVFHSSKAQDTKIRYTAVGRDGSTVNVLQHFGTAHRLLDRSLVFECLLNASCWPRVRRLHSSDNGANIKLQTWTV